MLQELVSKGTAAFDSSAALSASMATAAAQRLDEGIASLSATQNSIQVLSATHNSGVTALSASSAHQFTSDMTIVSEQRASADSMLATVSGMVGAKRKYLDVTVSDLCAHVDSAIEQGVAVVDATSATASKVLSDVSSASQAMNTTASQAMDTFTSFMDQEGEALSSGLQAHFGVVASHANEQTGDLVALKKAAGIHSESMEASRLQQTGSTPRKIAPISFEGPFKRTRSHGVIRASARTALVCTEEGAEGVTYDAARAGIAECIALSASLPTLDMDADEVSAPAHTVAVVEPVLEEIVMVADRTSTGSVSTVSSKESTSSKSQASCDYDSDAFQMGPSENVNPNITTTRQSRGNASKSRSRIAAPRSTRNALASSASDADL